MHRAISLNAKGEALLSSFMRFIESKLIVGSHEKRGVAFKLFVEIFARVPVDRIQMVMSKTIIRSLLATRLNKKHTLFNIAGQTLKSIASSSGKLMWVANCCCSFVRRCGKLLAV